MRRILFVKEMGKRQGQGSGPEYDAGSIHTFAGYVAESYAQAYIDRGYAVEAPQPDPDAPVAPAIEANSLSQKPTFSLSPKPNFRRR